MLNNAFVGNVWLPEGNILSLEMLTKTWEYLERDIRTFSKCALLEAFKRYLDLVLGDMELWFRCCSGSLDWISLKVFSGLDAS